MILFQNIEGVAFGLGQTGDIQKGALYAEV